MRRPTLFAVAALVALAACADTMAVTGRADNDILRFSAMNYAVASEAIGPY